MTAGLELPTSKLPWPTRGVTRSGRCSPVQGTTDALVGAYYRQVQVLRYCAPTRNSRTFPDCPDTAGATRPPRQDRDSRETAQLQSGLLRGDQQFVRVGSRGHEEEAEPRQQEIELKSESLLGEIYSTHASHPKRCARDTGICLPQEMNIEEIGFLACHATRPCAAQVLPSTTTCEWRVGTSSGNLRVSAGDTGGKGPRAEE